MKKITTILALLSFSISLMAQQTSDTITPYGQYLVTNGQDIAISRIENAILEALRSGSAEITSDNDMSGSFFMEKDTSLFVEILSTEALAQMQSNKNTQNLNIPKSVVISPKLLTIEYEDDPSPSNYPLTAIVSMENESSGWLLLREDKPPIRLSADGPNVYTLRIPGQKTLHIRRK